MQSDQSAVMDDNAGRQAENVTITAKLPDGRSENVTVTKDLTWFDLRERLASLFQLQLESGMHLRGVVRGRLLTSEDTMDRILQQAGIVGAAIVIHCVIPLDDGTTNNNHSSQNGNSAAQAPPDSQQSLPGEIRRGVGQLLNLGGEDGGLLGEFNPLLPFVMTAVGGAAGVDLGGEGLRDLSGHGNMENQMLNAVNSILSGTVGAGIQEIVLCDGGPQAANNQASAADQSQSENPSNSQQSAGNPPMSLGSTISPVLGFINTIISSRISGGTQIPTQPTQPVTHDNPSTAAAGVNESNPQEHENRRTEAEAAAQTENPLEESPNMGAAASEPQSTSPASAVRGTERWNRRGRESLRLASNAVTRSMFQRASGGTSVFGASPGSDSNQRFSSIPAQVFEIGGVLGSHGNQPDTQTNAPSAAAAESDQSRRSDNVLRVRFIRGRTRRDGAGRGQRTQGVPNPETSEIRRPRHCFYRHVGYASAQMGNAHRHLRNSTNIINAMGAPPPMRQTHQCPTTGIHNHVHTNAPESTSGATGEAPVGSNASHSSHTNDSGGYDATGNRYYFNSRFASLQDIPAKFSELDVSWACLGTLQESGGMMINVVNLEQRERVRQSRISEGTSIARVYMQELYMLDQAANVAYHELVVLGETRSHDDEFMLEKCVLMSALQGALAAAHAKASVLLSTGAYEMLPCQDLIQED